MGVIGRNSLYRFVFAGSEERWEAEGVQHRTSLLYRALSRSSRVEKVLAVHSPRSLPGRVIDALRGLKAPRATENSKLKSLRLTSWVPEGDNGWSRADRGRLAASAAGMVRRLGFAEGVLWIASPRVVDIAERIPRRLTVFDAVDNLLIHPQLRRFEQKIRRSYEWASRNADLIVIASEGQREMFPGNAKLFVLPNAIDEEFLRAGEGECPADLARVPSPRIVYVGVMQERMDIDLILRTVDSLPRHQFVFVGPELTPSYFDALRGRSNAHFLGAKDHRDVPAYLRHSQACVLPHKVDDFTNSMNPLKIYEYLASGKPIVSTPVAGTEGFTDSIYIGRDAASFTDAIKRALSADNPDREQSRRRLAEAHTWEKRVEDLLNRLDGVGGVS